MNLQKSDFQLESLVLRKAQAIEFFYPFLFNTLLYMALNKKDEYIDADTDAVLFKSFANIYEGRRKDGEGADFYTLSAAALHVIKERQIIFTATYGLTFFEFVRRFCEKELQAFDDYFTMAATGFSEEDMQTVMEGYMEHHPHG